MSTGLDLSDLAHVAALGHGLNVEELTGLGAALARLRASGTRGLKFWGRISGSKADYLIVCAPSGKVASSGFPTTVFFYWCARPVAFRFGTPPDANRTPARSTAGSTTKDFSLQEVKETYGKEFQEFVKPFARLSLDGKDYDPAVRPPHARACPPSRPQPLTRARRRPAQKNYRFSGVPTAVIEHLQHDSRHYASEGKVESKAYTEAHHLPFVLANIAAATSVVPAGSHCVNAQGEIAVSPLFSGLTPSAAASLASYRHLRDPLKQGPQWNARSASSSADEVLDTVGAGLFGAAGAWAVQISADQTTATVRSLEFPGYVAFHLTGTHKFGSAYFGDGQWNSSLAFMA
jgi:hypothetical protein